MKCLGDGVTEVLDSSLCWTEEVGVHFSYPGVIVLLGPRTQKRVHWELTVHCSRDDWFPHGSCRLRYKMGCAKELSVVDGWEVSFLFIVYNDKSFA